MLDEAWTMVRLGLVLLTAGLMTLFYYQFHNFVHHQHFFEHHNATSHNETFHNETSHHGRGSPFEGVYMKKEDFLLYGLALPLTILALISLAWNPISNPSNRPLVKNIFLSRHSLGDANVTKWTIIGFVIPLLYIMYDGAHGHFSNGRSQEHSQMQFSLWTSFLMSLMSPTGYAAVWALAAFLIPVTKHSPILDWLKVTPVQALAFHRIAGWTSLWSSILHGFLHLKHLMGVLNFDRPNPRPWYKELWILLVPSSWECVASQNPLAFVNGQEQLDDNQCWLALVNATGMISTLAFIVLAITSLPKFRRAYYTIFYRVHIPAAWTMLFMAIWHYPTCGLVMIPNIIYYLSCNIPVFVTQVMDSWSKEKGNHLVEANLIKGGALELVFCTLPKDRNRHENRFARLCHSAASNMSHPFSVFSRHDLTGTSPDTISILMRSSGPFTESLTQVLFPSYTSGSELFHQLVPQQTLPPASKIQVDSFYAGSFDWVDRAMLSHDRILLVAGGVGIVPFLEFLPTLQRRIEAATSADNEERHGPERIVLHWYCREVGLASYIWTKYLGPHVQQSWEAGRVQINLHLTSLHGEATTDVLTSIPKADLVTRTTYSSAHAVKDAAIAKSRHFALLLSGSIMVTGIVFHCLWYKKITIEEKFRMDNLIMRGHSIVLTVLVAFVVSTLVQLCASRSDKEEVTANPNEDLECSDMADSSDSTELLHISNGRPPVETVVEDVLHAKRPGVYMCGPHSLMESIENAIHKERRGCAFYREDSEL